MVDVQMDYDLVEEMARIFNESAEELDEMNGIMQQIADMMEGGALVGEGGAAFQDALRTQMRSALDKLSDKMRELALDCYGAISSLRDGDTESASRFS
jgi:uncharacterized protein YukE